MKTAAARKETLEKNVGVWNSLSTAETPLKRRGFGEEGRLRWRRMQSSGGEGVAFCNGGW